MSKPDEKKKPVGKEVEEKKEEKKKEVEEKDKGKPQPGVFDDSFEKDKSKK